MVSSTTLTTQPLKNLRRTTTEVASNAAKQPNYRNTKHASHNPLWWVREANEGCRKQLRHKFVRFYCGRLTSQTL